MYCEMNCHLLLAACNYSSWHLTHQTFLVSFCAKPFLVDGQSHEVFNCILLIRQQFEYFMNNLKLHYVCIWLARCNRKLRGVILVFLEWTGGTLKRHLNWVELDVVLIMQNMRAFPPLLWWLFMLLWNQHVNLHAHRWWCYVRARTWSVKRKRLIIKMVKNTNSWCISFLLHSFVVVISFLFPTVSTPASHCWRSK